eukprot:NODE_804_length_753_cov_2.092063_g795_i0.p1 GENE.NODE_804_length_753_cov_2.092063_g795_i0~~NODE_804_length_753_cov_2.092063_g795_i0.p1  ORF type:complete len:223 (+),score=76.56 NODE_804_length_753_cov_2.092063_g795_i0:32-700(+)
MRAPFLSLFMTSPFDGMQEHAEKVKECTWAFKKAIECYVGSDLASCDNFRQEIIQIEHEADKIKRRIRGHIPKGAIMPVDKFQLFRYLKEQDSVIDSVDHALEWISYRHEKEIPEDIQKRLFNLMESVIEVIEYLPLMMSETKKYFKNFSNDTRDAIKDMIRNIREKEHEADKVEYSLKRKAFELSIDPITLFHCVRLAEIIGSIADHAENAADMIRAMLAR